MRTTVTLADDVAAEVARLRRERGIGVSEALNELARVGMARTAGSPTQRRYHQRSAPLGLRLDVSNIAEVLDTLDDDDR